MKRLLQVDKMFLATAIAAALLPCAQAPAQTVSVLPGTTAVGQTAPAVQVTVTMTGSGTAAAPQAVTQGIATTDFTVGTGGTCAAGASYSAGQQCTVSVVFAPLYPGQRMGAVEVLANGGGLLGTTLVTGMATGSLAVLAPGEINTVAGNGAFIYTGDGVAATSAPIFLPMGVVADPAGNLYLADSNNNRVRRVDAVSGLISTVAGTGIPGFSGDGGPAAAAEVSLPSGLALDGAGNLYFADTGNSVIRRIDAITGVITTVAGIGQAQGYTGDGGPATAAKLGQPQGVTMDLQGDLIISDTANSVVREVNARTGVITTLAGTGTAGYSGDGGPAASALLDYPWSSSVGPDGSIYIADQTNNVVRKVAGGTITTVAGTGTKGFSGDSGPAKTAQLDAPAAMVLDPAGNLYIADAGNNRIREIDATTGVITTISGTAGQQFAGDGGPANLASMYGPYALYFDQAGDLFVADMLHNRVREISGTTLAFQYPVIKVGQYSAPQLAYVVNDGNANLDLLAPVFNQSALDSSTTTCATGSPMGPTIQCTLGVEFAPTQVGNSVIGTLTQPSDAGNSPIVITLSGQVLSVLPTTLTLSSSVNPSLLGQSVTFTGTIGVNGSVATGTVVFMDGTTQMCSSTVGTGNQATCTTSTLALGSHNITASYSGDDNDAAAKSGTLVQVVKQTPTLVLTAGPSPTLVGTKVTMTLTASAAVGTPTGAISFYDGTTLLSTVNLSSGVATYSTTTLTPGTHSLTAKYAGDAMDAPGTSNPVSEVINQATSTTTLAATSTNAVVGTSITFTATVVSTNGPMPTGTVNFTSNGTSIGTGTVGPTGIATLTTTALIPGSDTVVATYSGDTSNGSSASAGLVVTITQIATATVTTADLNPAKAGATVHLSATVSLAAGAVADGAITGTVTFMQGATTLGTASVGAGGVATLAINSLAVGTLPITAVYGGSTNYATSTSPVYNEVVNQTGTTTVVTASVASLTAGQSETFTATVTSSTQTPGGTVNFMNGGALLGTGTLNASGVATFITTMLPVGNLTITAVYVGNSSYTTSSGTVSVVVAQAGSATALISSVNPQIVGQSVMFTATVTSADPGLTGTVNFVDGSTALGSVTLGASGVATFTTSSLAFGNHSITAAYSGDANHAASTSTVLTEVIVQASTEALTSSVNPSVSGQNVVFSVKIAGVGTVIPTGTVTFKDGTTTLGIGTLDATGATSYATTALAVGSHTITANYSGDGSYSTATQSLTQIVGSANTQIVLTASANPATYATPVTITATITSNGSIATGSVTFTDGATTLGTGLLNASGVATLTTSTLTPGTHLIVATYAGDGKASASISGPLALVVKETTTVTLTTNANPAQTLSPIVLSASVTNAGVGVATGSITFTDGTTTLGTVTLDGSGNASLTVPSLTAGNHSIVASYAGDGNNFSGVSTTLVQNVGLRPTTTTLTALLSDPANPNVVTLIAVVRWAGTQPQVPTGTMTFTSGATTLGSLPIDGTGVATFTITLQSASETVVATYSGDTAYAGSASAATKIVGGAATQFTLGLNPSSMTMVTKQHGATTLTLTSLGSFTDNMELGCVGLPFAATCTFSKTQVNLAANGTQVVTLTVDTGDPLGAGATASVAGKSNGVVLAFLPAGLLLGFGLWRSGKSRRKLGVLLLAVCAVVMSISATGCSGLQINGTPAGTYTFGVTATGTGTGATQTQTMTLTVTAQ